jgi:hypothetical protein
VDTNLPQVICMFLVMLHLFMCQRKQKQSWIPKVSNAYSLVIVKKLKGINCTTQYVIINRDVIFDESINFNEKQWFQGWIMD